MNTLKTKNMLKAYGGFAGAVTINAILEQIPDTLKSGLTGSQLGLVMRAVNEAYHKGKGTLNGISKVDDCLWIPNGENGMLVPIAAVKTIRKIDAVENGKQVAKYTMDFTEEY